MIRILIRRTGMLAASTALTLGVTAWALAAEPKVGDKAPAFELQGSDGKTYSLDQFKGKKAVVVAWFPKAFTGGCTKECKSFKENSADMKKMGVAYFTASVDTPELNKKFAESLELDYPILSDPSKKVAEAYGVVHEGRAVPERWTFYIDKEGVIKAVDKAVQKRTVEAGPDVVAKVKELGLNGE
jgi:thioredoxin-dependent peroxiredoxin